MWQERPHQAEVRIERDAGRIFASEHGGTATCKGSSRRGGDNEVTSSSATMYGAGLKIDSIRKQGQDKTSSNAPGSWMSHRAASTIDGGRCRSGGKEHEREDD